MNDVVVPSRLALAPASPAEAMVPALPPGHEVWLEPAARKRWIVDTTAAVRPTVRAARREPHDGVPTVAVELDDAGAKAFAALTAARLDRIVVFALDEEVLAAPIVKERIPSGRLWLTCPAGACDGVAERLVGGPLPIPLELRSEDVIGR